MTSAPVLKKRSLLQQVTTLASRAGGYGLLGIAAMICVDTISRKLFKVSITGSTEITGFVFAFATGVAIAYAALFTAHIRLDVVQRLLPTRLRGSLDVLAALTMLIGAAILSWNEWLQLKEALEFDATSTLLNIPLVYPHALFLLGLLLFTLVSALVLIGLLRRFPRTVEHPGSEGHQSLEDLGDL
ncbi:TRAP transporter small permease [Martelella mediterranea]|uniref:TRAP transporter small permease n=1 Tax=Martelella mediterranea TaxID=293089 RepID=UPI001E4E0BAD|nr:TRAP transporter small permease [Martelella mediterranea]MCD1635180.1 TRAP transporter small permease [Martelella mediterranea]